MDSPPFQVHIVGSSAELDHAPLSTPALFAQLVYRTRRPPALKPFEVSASVVSVTGQQQQRGASSSSTIADPVLLAVAAHLSGKQHQTAATCASEEGESMEGMLHDALSVVEPYASFGTQFSDSHVDHALGIHSSTSSNNDNDNTTARPLDLILCVDTASFDNVSTKLFNRFATTSASASQQAPRHTVVVAHVQSDAPQKLPLLYSALVTTLATTAAAAAIARLSDNEEDHTANDNDVRLGWVHALDDVLQRFQSLRSCQVLCTVVG